MTTKRFFDLFLASLALVLLGPLMGMGYGMTSLATGSNGLFCQKRIGQYGRVFTIYKLKTIHPRTGRVTVTGRIFRKYKLDELPQLANILMGEMTFVGPRPDIQGYYDKLQGEALKILELKPGLTCLASIKYRKEEEILAGQANPQAYNDQVIFPDKLKMNLDYYYNNSFWGDIKILLKTFKAILR